MSKLEVKITKTSVGKPGKFEPEPCNCEQALAAEQTIKDLNGEIILRDARIRVLEATAREGMERIERNFRLEKLVEDMRALIVNPSFDGLPCTALSQINRLITDYQNEKKEKS